MPTIATLLIQNQEAVSKLIELFPEVQQTLRKAELVESELCEWCCRPRAEHNLPFGTEDDCPVLLGLVNDDQP